MDLNTITAISRPRQRDEIAPFAHGDAWLAGGTALFSEPQPQLSRLVDLRALDWPALTWAPEGLEIAATCTLAQLDEASFPPEALAAPLVGQCCAALYGSFKVRAAATVGGNLCMALPAGPMISLTVALEGVLAIWQPDGGTRHAAAQHFVRTPGENSLASAELLRSILLPAAALRRRTAFRRIALNPLGRSAALVIGTLDPAGAFALTVTAATRRPQRLTFADLPDADALAARLAADIPAALYHDDVHGAPDWRRHMTALFAQEIRTELADGQTA